LQLNVEDHVTKQGKRRDSGLGSVNSVEFKAPSVTGTTSQNISSFKYIFFRRTMHKYNQKVLAQSSPIERLSIAINEGSRFSQCDNHDKHNDGDNENDKVYEWKDEDGLPPRARFQVEVQSSSYAVLMVDDSVPSRSMLSKLLRSRCSKLDEAGDGLQAIQMVETSKVEGSPYDIIFMDSEMPNMNGPEATRLIRDKLGYQGLIIGVTGNALPEDIANFKDHGADDVLVKPLKVSQFDEVLQKIRRRRIDLYMQVENNVLD